jgi:hypothetical protein
VKEKWEHGVPADANKSCKQDIYGHERVKVMTSKYDMVSTSTSPSDLHGAAFIRFGISRILKLCNFINRTCNFRIIPRIRR